MNRNYLANYLNITGLLKVLLLFDLKQILFALSQINKGKPSKYIKLYELTAQNPL